MVDAATVPSVVAVPIGGDDVQIIEQMGEQVIVVGLVNVGDAMIDAAPPIAAAPAEEDPNE